VLKVGRLEFDSLAESNQKTLRVDIHSFLLDVQHKRGIVWRQAGKFTCCVFGQGTYQDWL